MKGTADHELRRMAMGALEAAVLVRGTTGKDFRLVEPAPSWWEPVFGSVQEFRDRSPFLDDFADGIGADFWEGRELVDEPSFRSGIWEEDAGGTRRFFEAIAVRADKPGAPHLLLIQASDERWRQEQAFVQNAHDQSLNRRRLLKEVEKKQVLLECIMHDLGNPVATVHMSLQHIGHHLGDENRGLQLAVQRALSQTKRQHLLIRSIAEVFASDLASDRWQTKKEYPDLMAVAAETAAACASLAAEAGVTLCPFFSGAMPVQSEKLALSRVIENLLVNAIRHSPRGRCVTLRFEKDEKMATCRVEDAGTGIEPGLQDRLFQAFSQGGSNHGQSGLGLYFCRLSVEKWGGSIHAWNRKQGGACFEFSLPLVQKEADS